MRVKKCLSSIMITLLVTSSNLCLATPVEEKSDFDKTLNQIFTLRQAGKEQAVLETRKQLEARARGEIAAAASVESKTRANEHLIKSLLVQCQSLERTNDWTALYAKSKELKATLLRIGPPVDQFMPQAYKWEALSLFVPGKDMNAGALLAQKALDFRKKHSPTSYNLIEADTLFCAECALQRGDRKKQREYLESCLQIQDKYDKEAVLRIAATLERLCDACLNADSKQLDARAEELMDRALAIRKVPARGSQIRLLDDYLRLANATAKLQKKVRVEAALREANKLAKVLLKNESMLVVLYQTYKLTNDTSIKKQAFEDIQNVFADFDKNVKTVSVREIRMYAAHLDFILEYGTLSQASTIYERMNKLADKKEPHEQRILLLAGAKLWYKQGKYNQAEHAVNQLLSMMTNFHNPQALLPMYELQEKIYAAEKKEKEKAQSEQHIAELRKHL